MKTSGAMHCPRCESSLLLEKEREGIVVDSCPACRGLWLDRGELEKLLARAAREVEEREGRDHRGDDDHHDHPPSRPPMPREHGYRHEDGRGFRKKKHWLETLGDIFD